MILAPNVQMYFQLTVTRARDGKVMRRTRKLKCHSFLEQYAQFVRCAWNNADEASVENTRTSTDTLLRPGGSAVPWMSVKAGATDDDYGILVGTGSTAVAMTDRKLATKVAHGITPGTELEYSAHVFGSHTQSGSDASFTFRRAFANNTGVALSSEVAEVGVAVLADEYGGVDTFFQIIRDVLGTTVPVLHGEVLTVTYTYTISV